jgi:hypothetical protein
MNKMNNMQKTIMFYTVFTAFLFFNFNLSSQELDPIVDADMSKIGIDAQDRLSTFKQDITNYLSRTRFSDENIVNDIKGKAYKIKCNFQFIFNSATGFDSYDAQLVFTVSRNIYKSQTFTQILRIKDENWAFTYVKGQTFYHDDLKYNNLTSFLDYYAYLAIGIDDDSWELKLGTERFRNAQNIVNLAVSNSSDKGWSDNNVLKASRYTYPAELLNSRYEEFRKAFWIFHFGGIDSLQYGKRNALERISLAIEMIGKVKKLEVKSFIIKSFFDIKFMEIAQALTDYYDKTIYKKLMDIDPDHAGTYAEFAKK